MELFYETQRFLEFGNWNFWNPLHIVYISSIQILSLANFLFCLYVYWIYSWGVDLNKIFLFTLFQNKFSYSYIHQKDYELIWQVLTEVFGHLTISWQNIKQVTHKHFTVSLLGYRFEGKMLYLINVQYGKITLGSQ